MSVCALCVTSWIEGKQLSNDYAKKCEKFNEACLILDFHGKAVKI